MRTKKFFFKINKKSLFGWFLVLTMIRPYPFAAYYPVLSGRIVDLVWFFLAGFFLFCYIPLKRNKMGAVLIFWMVAIMYSTIISLYLAAVFFNNNVIIQDLFELYRMPYYLLVLTFSMQFKWSRKDILRYFVRPMIIGVGLMMLVSFLQMQRYSSMIKEILGYVYYLKTTAFVILPYGRFYMRNNGTFANPNYFSVALVILIPFIAASYSLSHSLRYCFIIAACLFFAFFMLITTGSRSGWAAMMMSFVIYVMLAIAERFRKKIRTLKSRRHSTKLPMLLLSVSVIAMIFLVLPMVYRWESTKTAFLTQAGLRTIDSFVIKTEEGLRFLSEALEKSPLFGFGPAKATDRYLGDNQYSKYFYRYGMVGLIVWFGFWVSLLWKAFIIWCHPKNSLQVAFSRALLCVVPGFLLACVGGDFFDATQIMTLMLILVGGTLSLIKNTGADYRNNLIEPGI